MTTDLDNVSDALKYLRDQWDRQLKEEYERGHLDGQKYGYVAGYDAGHKDVFATLEKLMSEKASAEPTSEPEAAPVPEPEPILLDAPASNVSAAVAPGLQRALDYVRDHPGATSKEIYIHVRNNAAVYTLAKRGLIEKRGSQFYPKDAT